MKIDSRHMFVGSQPKHFLVDASTIGLQPGKWPATFEIDNLQGESVVFLRTMLHYESAGSLFVGHKYESAEGHYLLVIND